MKQKLFIILILLFYSISLLAQSQKTRVYGYVIDETNRGIDGASVRFENSSVGTITNKNGYYDLQIEVKDSVKIIYSHLGFETIVHHIKQDKAIVQITVVLPNVSKELHEVQVVGNRRSTSTMQTINPEKYKLMPNTSGNFESLLISFSGVTSNNELSSQYNVRGGNFDENIVYVNGTEVYRPLLIRAGQQEGLSFINPDMVKNVSFSSGGFNAEYGDKMSSVLDVAYKKPTAFEASVMASLLGASVYIGVGNERFTQLHGIRYKTSKYLLGTLDTKGNYQPNFIDYQTYMTYKLNSKWEISLLGNISRNNYSFIPEDQETRFGTLQKAEKLKIYFLGQEKDLFQTYFGALSLNYQPRENVKLSFTASGFHTNENETFDITGEYVLNEINPSDSGEAEEGEALGVGRYHQHARNRLKARVVGVGHKGEFAKSGHSFKWGLHTQQELIKDNMREWEWRDSAGYSMPYKNDKVLELYYNLKSKQSIQSVRTSGYLQDTYKWDTDKAVYAITGGVRGSYWTYNKEFLVSPRLSFSILPHWEKDFTFRIATGMYYQTPFYKELRDTVIDASKNVYVQLNNKLKAQRSVHFVLGGDYLFRALGRPFKFTAEAYLKLADRVTSYSVDNVRVRYSGLNDAKAYTVGIDFKLFGELVPGTDSWINFSLMQSKEDILNDFYVNKAGQTIYPKWISRPNEQRYSFSMLFTDYLPNNPNYKLYLKAMYSDGLPVGPPHSPRYLGDAFRLRAYRRVDIGASRVLVRGKDKVMDKSWLKYVDNASVSFEIFNLFDFKNEHSISWISDVYNNQHGSPNHLTGRQYNLKFIIDLK